MGKARRNSPAAAASTSSRNIAQPWEESQGEQYASTHSKKRARPSIIRKKEAPLHKLRGSHTITPTKIPRKTRKISNDICSIRHLKL